MSEIEVQRGDNVWLVGLAEGHTIVRRQSTVITSTMAVAVQPPSVPRFRAVHEEACFASSTTSHSLHPPPVMSTQTCLLSSALCSGGPWPSDTVEGPVRHLKEFSERLRHALVRRRLSN